MFTEVSLEHHAKAPAQMVCTELGISIEVRPSQLKKALFPIDVTVLGMIVFLHPKTNALYFVDTIALQLSRES
jgi:hypothetical protein